MPTSVRKASIDESNQIAILVFLPPIAGLRQCLDIPEYTVVGNQPCKSTHTLTQSLTQELGVSKHSQIHVLHSHL